MFVSTLRCDEGNDCTFWREVSYSKTSSNDIKRSFLAFFLAMSLIFACATCVSAADPVFVTPNNSLFDLEKSMSQYYLDLSHKGELPVQQVRDDIGITPQDLMYALGLMRGGGNFPQDLAALLCRLNPTKCSQSGKKLTWTNKAGDVLCLPAIEWRDAATLVRAKIPLDKDLVATLQHRYGTCSVLGNSCSSKISTSAERVDQDGYIEALGLAQAALEAKPNAPTTCADATPQAASVKIAPVGWSHIPCKDCRRIDNYRARQQEIISASVAGSISEGNFAPISGAIGTSAIGTSSMRRVKIKTPWPTADISVPVSSLTSADIARIHAQISEQMRAQATTAKAKGGEIDRVNKHYEQSSTEDKMSSAESSAEIFEAVPNTRTKPERSIESELATETAVAISANEPEPIPITSISPTPTTDRPAASSNGPASTTTDSACFDDRTDLGTPSGTVALASVVNPALAEANLRDRLKPLAEEHTVRVLVFDTRVDCCHPILRRAMEASCTDAVPQQFNLLSEPSKDDHGSHISGLIAGDYGVGVHPGAHVSAVALLTDSTVATFGLKQEQKIVTALFETSAETRVANFSLKLNTQDAIANTNLAKQFVRKPHILFVAAAGDGSNSLNNGCDVIPACLSINDRTNLIVVGGAQRVNGQWQLWPASSYGSLVDILAPAVGALSALREQRWVGAMDGTSQSAALISGLAARLFELTPEPGAEWSPVQVRNRLMATARFVPQLQGKSKSGIVDGDRALETEHQVLVRKLSDGTSKTLIGHIQQLLTPTGEATNSDVAFVHPDGNYSFCRMYRLARQGTGNKWVLAYQPRGEGIRWGSMDLFTDAEMSYTSKVLSFQVEGEVAPTKIPFSDLIDFYDAFSGGTSCQQ